MLTSKEIRQFLLGDKITIIYQLPKPYLNPWVSVGHQIVEFISQKHKLSFVESKKIGLKMLKLLQFQQPEKVFHSLPSRLSGGMQQRINIASAILPMPRLIILDEFLSSLDFEIKEKILNLLVNLCKKYKITLFWITHNLKLALKYSNISIILSPNRQLAFYGLTKNLTYELKKNPLSFFIRNKY